MFRDIIKWEKMIWAVSVLFCEFFLNVDRTIAKKGDSYVNYSNAYQAKIFWQKNEWSEYKKLREYASEKGGLFAKDSSFCDLRIGI